MSPNKPYHYYCIIFTHSTSSERSRSVTSPADTCALSESPEQMYLKHHYSRKKVTHGPPCARLAAIISPTLLTNQNTTQTA